MHFTEHLVDAFKKSSQKSDLNQDPSSLLIRWPKNHTDQLNHDMSIASVAHKEIDKLEEKPKQDAPELSRALHCTGWDAVEARRQTKSKRGEQRTAGQKLILHRLQQATE
jgi:hypothetical protein